MTDPVQEIFDILQEECGELITSISKVRRFGIDNSYKDGGSQREHLTQEAGDVLLMIDLLVERGILDREQLEAAKHRKSEKLKVWSNIYK